LATALAAQGHDAVHIADWHAGAYLHARDAELLARAAPENRIIVTADSATLPLDAYTLLSTGVAFAGVLVVTRAIGQRDIGALMRAVQRTIASQQTLINQVLYLPSG
jgi:predicted nuclease of predicted toxin-antitoxin system